MFLVQNLMQNLNLAIKNAYLESTFQNLETISSFPNLFILHMFLGQNLIQNLNLATKYAFWKVIFRTLLDSAALQRDSAGLCRTPLDDRLYIKF